MSLKIINSIYDKNLEIRYNEMTINGHKIELQGKIKCPVLNEKISSYVCCQLMDRADWPRGIKPTCCDECSCYIHKSIKKYSKKKKSD